MYGSDGSRPLDYERAEVVKAGKKDLPGSRRKTLLSEWISLLKKCLTGPTLLEMYGKCVNQELKQCGAFYSIRFNGILSPPVCNTILTTRPPSSVSNVNTSSAVFEKKSFSLSGKTSSLGSSFSCTDK